jgi:nitrite reductase/ring-hydroxylating ferredoxin subunit
VTQGPFPEPKPPPIVCVTADPVVRRRIEGAARDLEAILLGFRATDEVDLPAPPRVLVVDLRLDGALDAIRRWRIAYAGAPIVGVLAVPRPELWRDAETAGADFVTTHGVVHRQLRGFLEEHAKRKAGVRRARVAPMQDFEGRLGYVGRLEDGVPEEIALYHVGYEICAVGNTCPHAGGRLSDGELDGSVITCPLHGSQFDVCTGQRLRGPSDDPVATYDVVVEGGAVFVEFQEG